MQIKKEYLFLGSFLALLAGGIGYKQYQKKQAAAATPGADGQNTQGASQMQQPASGGMTQEQATAIGLRIDAIKANSTDLQGLQPTADLLHQLTAAGYKYTPVMSAGGTSKVVKL